MHLELYETSMMEFFLEKCSIYQMFDTVLMPELFDLPYYKEIKLSLPRTF